MTPQEPPPVPDPTRRYRWDLSALEAPTISEPPPPGRLIIATNLPSIDLAPTVEARQVGIEEGELPSPEELFSSQGGQ